MKSFILRKSAGVSMILLSVLLIFIPLVSEAAGIVPCGQSVDDPGTADSIESDRCTLCHLIIGIQRIINYGAVLLVIAAITAITIAGVMYIVSSGNNQLMESAKGYIKQALTGVVIVLGAWFIINYSMVLLGAKSDLGIAATGGRWWEFKCVAAAP